MKSWLLIFLLVWLTIPFVWPTRSFAQTNDQLEIVRQAEQASGTQNWKEAEKLWARATGLNPVNQGYLNNYGMALYFNKKYREALNIYLSHLKMGGWRPPVTAYNIASCYG